MKGKKQIQFQTEFNRKLEENILCLLHQKWGETGGLTFQELAKRLNINLHKKGNWDKLRLHLWKLGKEGYIEERHFLDGKVAYSLEDKGMERVSRKT